MRRALAAIAAYGCLVALVTACKHDSLNDCLESGATAYQVALGGDTAETFRWPASFQPVRFYAEPVGVLQENTDSGLALWANAFRCNELAMVRVTDSTTADVILRSPPQMPPVPNAPVLHADSVGACLGRTDVVTDTVAGVETLVRPLRSYIVAGSLDTTAVAGCFRFTTAHEIGHTLGIFAHSGNVADLMYTVPRRRFLSPNDRYTVELLYHLDHVGIVPSPR